RVPTEAGEGDAHPESGNSRQSRHMAQMAFGKDTLGPSMSECPPAKIVTGQPLSRDTMHDDQSGAILAARAGVPQLQVHVHVLGPAKSGGIVPGPVDRGPPDDGIATGKDRREVTGVGRWPVASAQNSEYCGIGIGQPFGLFTLPAALGRPANEV